MVASRRTISNALNVDFLHATDAVLSIAKNVQVPFVDHVMDIMTRSYVRIVTLDNSGINIYFLDITSSTFST
jgi:hypothetical protein